MLSRTKAKSLPKFKRKKIMPAST